MAKRKTSKNTPSTSPILSITLPAGWGELTGKQVAAVAHEILNSENQNHMLVKLAAEFAGLLPRGSILDATGNRVYCYYHRITGNITLNAGQVTAIVDALRWLSVKNIAPMAAPPLDGYPTPDHQLRGATLEQFITADVAFMAVIRDGGPHALRVLAASLYAREHYDPSMLQRDAQRIKRLDSKLYGVFIWFLGVKALFAKTFPAVFDGDSGDGRAPSGGEYLLGLLSSLNGGDATKNEQLKALNVYEALYELDNKIKTAKKDV